MRIEVSRVLFGVDGGPATIKVMAARGSGSNATPFLDCEVDFAVHRHSGPVAESADIERIMLRGGAGASVTVHFHPPAYHGSMVPIDTGRYRRRAAMLIANIAVNGVLESADRLPPSVVLSC